MSEGALLPTWVILTVWIGYGVGGFYFMFSRNLARKRRLLRPYILGSDVLFLAVLAAMGFPPFMLLVAAPFVAFITFLNLRHGLRFCEQCGATVWSMVPFMKPQHCSNCGATLKTPVA
jgi:ribosomal protein S27AE